MKHTSKKLIEMMKKEYSEDRLSLDEMIQQMDYKLNKRIALLENSTRIHMLLLNRSLFTPPGQDVKFVEAAFAALRERIQIGKMPASPIFKKGGFHHKFVQDDDSGEIVMKHPPKTVSNKTFNYFKFIS